jgi:hypothetical protein
MFSKSVTKHSKGLGSRFTELHTKLHADTLLDFAVHHRQNKTGLHADTLLDFAVHHRQNKTGSQKSTRVKKLHVHSMVSHGRLMQQACGSVTLASLLIFFHRGSYNSNSPATFQYTSYNIM